VKVLLADDNGDRVSALAQVLEGDGGLTILRLRAGELLPDAVAALIPDVVLVDMGRPDHDALDEIRQISASNPRPIVLFVGQDDPSFMEQAIGAGVSSYNVLGIPPPDVKPILRAATALFRRHQSALDGMRNAENRLQEREIVDRAKAILIRDRKLNEPDAYRWLRRQAMARGRRIIEVARDVVRDKQGQTP
jgi:two-component system, response regulator / RNA-binding antiterminator